jgi:hypothetical protein
VSLGHIKMSKFRQKSEVVINLDLKLANPEEKTEK